MIEFKKDTEINQYYDPSEDKVKKTQIEIRYDPLTGRTSRILEKPLPMEKGADMSEIDRGFCPFCPGSIEDVGARDSKILDGEFMEEGESTLLSNISPYAEYSLVIPLTKTHYLPLTEFETEHFLDALKLIHRYLIRLSKKETGLYPTIIMNYLKPAGSSILHPHLQLMVTGNPFEQQERIFSAEDRFKKEYGVPYWAELVKQENDSDRSIAGKNGFTWLSPFAPLGLEHVRGIADKDFMDFDKKYFKGLSQGIVNVLNAYQEMGKNSFNMSINLSPLKDSRNRTIVDMVARSNFDKYYWCDVFSLEKLLGERYSNKNPENIAEYMKEFF
ncbi:MAG: hypothetical protein ACOC53_04770 [Candidatus Saliniplasma sp.]